MVYRDADEALRHRRDELRARRQREWAALPAAVPMVYVRRRARAMAGLVGIGGALVLALAALTQERGLTAILQASWLSIFGAYGLARFAARAEIDRARVESLAPTDDFAADILRLEELTAGQVVRELADRLERRSVALPMAALALLLPLTSHYVCATVFRVVGPSGARDFDGWIRLSLLFVGHCHLILAIHAWRFARTLRATTDALAVQKVATRSAWTAWRTTVVSSVGAGLLMFLVLPILGLALVMLAPALVALTGLACTFPVFARMASCLREERLLLAYPSAAP